MTRDMSTTEFMKTVATLAEHYGFVPHKEKKFDIPPTDTPPDTTPMVSSSYSEQHLDALIAKSANVFLSEYTPTQQPILFYCITTTEHNDTAITFHVYNVERSIAEALLINLNYTIAKELGWNEPLVRLNSIGDSDSLTRYTREVANFLRKRLEHVDGSVRELMKQHPLLALRLLIANDHELSYKSPSSIEYLSDQSRKHFREIIEFLDISNTPYEIDSRLIGHYECYSDVLFQITNQTPHTEAIRVTISGGRHNELLYRHTKRRMGATSAAVVFHDHPPPNRLPRVFTSLPHVYLIQLGFGPKIRTLLMIDELRRASISLYQNIASDSLSYQLREAEQKQVPYVLIIGQKEFVDGTVILRDMKNRTQEALLASEAIKKIKRAASIIAH